MKRSTTSEQALILAPRGRDAAIAEGLLAEAGLSAHRCGSLPELVELLDAGAAFVVVTEEALGTADLLPLTNWLRDQQEWSDLPFILLTTGGGGLERNPAARRYLDVLGNVAFLERPFHPTTLVSLARSALRSRRRQYEARARLDALRESEARRAAALEIAQLGTFEWDLRTDQVTLDRRSREIFGFAPEEGSTAQEVLDRIHPDDLERVASEITVSAAALAALDIEYRIVRPDGTIWTVASLSHLTVGLAGQAERMMGVFADVTERRRSETALRELNETLERRVAEVLAERKVFADLVEGTDAFVQVIDLDFRWMAINRAAANEFARVHGVRPVVGGSLLDALAHLPEQRDALRALWARSLSGESFSTIDEVTDPSRDTRYHEAKFNVLRDVSGRPAGAYQFIYDVTERVREQERLVEAEEQLRQSQKMEAMGQLTGGVAHDFNNLLTPIVGALDLLQRKGYGGEREKRLIAGAMQSAERAKTLVQRLLAFARRQPLQATAVSISRLVAGMADLIASTSGPQIKVVVETPADLLPARADPNQLEMALLNLCVNARDAMAGGGILRIGAHEETVGFGHRSQLRPGRYVCLSVADNGVGMDEVTLEHAIEPFFSTKGVGKGTGLGLSMVHGLASQLGGALTIRSRTGVGTDIELWLPISESPAETAGPIAEAGAALNGSRTVLLVEDEPLIRISTSDMLSDMGYTVVEASSAEEALNLIREGLRPHVLVSDHLMPGMNGTELARIIRAKVPDVQVLIVSGYAESDGLATDLPRLNKPFRNEELAAMLAKLG